MDGFCIFIFSLDFSFELLVHISNPLLNILSRCCVSLSKDQDIVLGIPQNVVVLVYKSLLFIHIAV